jgi:Zn-dependent protease with chaperone function
VDPIWVIPNLGLYAALIAFWWFVGIPAVGGVAVTWMPESWKERISTDIRDRSPMFNQSSRLGPEARTIIEDRVVQMAKVAGLRVDVQFVAGKPQAWALPDGTLIFTDGLIGLLSEEEVDAVAAHELGHVHYEHGLRNMAESTAALMLLTGASGDSGRAGQAAVQTAAVFRSLSHSRRNERAADAFAFDLLIKTGRSPLAFVSAFRKITRAHQIAAQEAGAKDAADDAGYFSTHPPTEGRSKAAEAAAAKASAAR